LFRAVALLNKMEEIDDDLDSGLPRSLDYLWKFDSPLIGIAKTQADLQRTLKPYQSMFEATAKIVRMSELSGVMGIAQVLQEQSRKWDRDYGGIIGISKMLQQQPGLLKPSLMIAPELARSIAKGLPDSYTTTIASIARQHSQFFENSYKVWPMLSSPIASQLANMQTALNGISGTIAKLTAQHQQWDLMRDFESASAQAIELSDVLVEESALSEENETAFRTLVDFIVSFIKRNRKVGLHALRFVEVVIMIAALHQYYYFLKDKHNGATKQDIKSMETRLLGEVSKRLSQEKELRMTNRLCRIYLKPRTKSMILLYLPKGVTVSILQVSHKWAFISFNDPRDNYAQTGWVLKKYIVKIAR
jgi:hypothetical protein